MIAAIYWPVTDVAQPGENRRWNFFASPLKPFRLFLIFRLPRYAVRVPSGARERRAPVGVRSLLVSNLLNGGFGYEDHNFRFRPPLAVHHRL